MSSDTQLCIVPPFSGSSWVLITHPLWWLLTWSLHFALPVSPDWSWFWNPCSGLWGKKGSPITILLQPCPSTVSGQIESAGQLFCLPESQAGCLSAPQASVWPPWLCWDRTCLSKPILEVCVALPSLALLFLCLVLTVWPCLPSAMTSTVPRSHDLPAVFFISSRVFPEVLLVPPEALLRKI